MFKIFRSLWNQIKGVKGSTPSLSSKQSQKSLIDAIIKVESSGNDMAVGDRNLLNQAYGPLQIRQPYIDDVNRIYGTDYRAIDCCGNRKLSIEIFEKYMSIYCTEKRIGVPVTDEIIARIHNGGPNGYKRASTLPYWEKVKELLHKESN